MIEGYQFYCQVGNHWTDEVKLSAWASACKEHWVSPDALSGTFKTSWGEGTPFVREKPKDLYEVIDDGERWIVSAMPMHVKVAEFFYGVSDMLRPLALVSLYLRR